MARVADWICDRLSEEGVKHIFLPPGGGAMYLNDAAATRADIAGISCHHEQAELRLRLTAERATQLIPVSELLW